MDLPIGEVPVTHLPFHCHVLLEHIDRVRETCLKRKKPIGIIGVTVDAAKPFLDQGYSLIAVGIDTMIFGHAARDIVTEMKGGYAGQKR